MIVKPGTLIGWHRKGFRSFWRWKSRPGRPPLPQEIRALIARMAREIRLGGNCGWPPSSRSSWALSSRRARWEPNDRGRRRVSSQCWATFVRNHAMAIVACDFMVAVTAQFQFLYVFVVLELGTRRILHHNVTAHPTAEWTLQQVRDAMPNERQRRSLIHDRDSIFSAQLDDELLTPMRLLHPLTHHRRNKSAQVPKTNPEAEVPRYPSDLQLNRVNECSRDFAPTVLGEVPPTHGFH
jgi:putative transposase